jgi:hypothetical protein
LLSRGSSPAAFALVLCGGPVRPPCRRRKPVPCFGRLLGRALGGTSRGGRGIVGPQHALGDAGLGVALLRHVPRRAAGLNVNGRDRHPGAANANALHLIAPVGASARAVRGLRLGPVLRVPVPGLGLALPFGPIPIGMPGRLGLLSFGGRGLVRLLRRLARVGLVGTALLFGGALCGPGRRRGIRRRSGRPAMGGRLHLDRVVKGPGKRL